jgi:hypothetical protein
VGVGKSNERWLLLCQSIEKGFDDCMPLHSLLCCVQLGKDWV